MESIFSDPESTMAYFLYGILFPENVTCPVNYVKCPKSYCLSTNKVCDGVKDCPFGEDEVNCGRYISFLYCT